MKHHDGKNGKIIEKDTSFVTPGRPIADLGRGTLFSVLSNASLGIDRIDRDAGVLFSAAVGDLIVSAKHASH